MLLCRKLYADQNVIYDGAKGVTRPEIDSNASGHTTNVREFTNIAVHKEEGLAI